MQSSYLDIKSELREIYLFEYSLPSERYALVTQEERYWHFKLENDMLLTFDTFQILSNR